MLNLLVRWRVVCKARSECDLVVATIFVNPKQFAAHEDLDEYPRQMAADVDQLAKLGVDFVFTPSTDEMYPAGK